MIEDILVEDFSILGRIKRVWIASLVFWGLFVMLSSPLTGICGEPVEQKKTVSLEVNSGSFVLNPFIVDHILPALSPSELKNESTLLQIPSDLLRLSNSLFMRRFLYRDSICEITSDLEKGEYRYVILPSQPRGDSLTLDKGPLTPGTVKTLRFMNGRFLPPEKDELVSFSALKKQLHHRQNRDIVRAALARQQVTTHAEVGGFLTLFPVSEEKSILRFNFVQTEGEVFIQRFKDASARDWKEAAKLMENNPEEFAFLPYQYRSSIATLRSDLPEEKKEARTLMFIDLYLFMARHTYYPDSTRYVQLFADETVPGYFVGDFHIHPPENDASYEDKVNSFEQRVIIVIPRDGGFDLVDLENTPPHSKPTTVIRVRNDEVQELP